VPEPRAITPRGDLASEEQSTIELFRLASPSVVHVTSVEVQRSRLTLSVHEIPQGTGSGILWDSDGHVVTNFHVIQSGSQADVTLNDNTVWKAKIVGVAEDKDLAVLKIEAPKEKLRPLAVGTSNNLQVGQKVFAIGNPFGLDQTLTTGVISGLGREIQSITKRPIRDVIQTDAAINPGNSGGPLLDSAGRLIGINTAIYSPSGAYAGIGFAVPVDTINLIVPELVAHGKVLRPGLGIFFAAESIARQLNLKGVLVLDMQPGGAAARAGLIGTQKAGDGGWVLGDVIIGMDQQPVNDVNDLYRELDKHKVGDEVTLDVVRRNEKRQVKLKLQALPEP
jgi:S1-C subfamily serine protease